MTVAVESSPRTRVGPLTVLLVLVLGDEITRLNWLMAALAVLAAVGVLVLRRRPRRAAS